MSSHEKLELFWRLVPYLLAVLGFLFGKGRNLLRLPQPVARLLKNPNVVSIIEQGVEAADAMQGKSDAEKREYVRAWAKSELYNLLGDWLPDAVVNLLIELTINRIKGER